MVSVTLGDVAGLPHSLCPFSQLNSSFKSPTDEKSQSRLATQISSPPLLKQQRK